MKKIILCFLLVFLSFYSTRAEVPFGQFSGILEKSPQLQFSLLWGEILLKSDVLKRIRFFGNYTSSPNPEYPSLAVDTPFNYPQDPIATLVQYLFPSPDNAILTHNDRRNDPFGEIALKKRFDILNKLLEISIGVSKKELDFPSANRKIHEVFTSFREDLEKEEKPKAHAIETAAKILTQALFYENPHNLYPPHMAIYTLLAFACKMGDDMEELAPLTAVLKLAERKTPPFTKSFYDQNLKHFLTELKKGVASAEKIFLFKQGYVAYYRPVPDLLVFQKTKFHPEGRDLMEYSDCGETSLRNLFYILLGTGGHVLPAALDHLETVLHDHKNFRFEATYQEFLSFMRKHPDISMARNTVAREEWSQLVSGLNERTPLPKNKIRYRKEAVCNLPGDGGIINMLSVIEKLIPDLELGAAWAGNMRQDLILASNKLNRLCTLFSRKDFELTWGCDEREHLPENTNINIIFSINGRKTFAWKITDIHFEIIPFDSPQNYFSFSHDGPEDWKEQRGVSSAIVEKFSGYDPLIRDLLIDSNIISRLPEIFPYYLWGLNLETLPISIGAIDLTISHNWESFWPLPQILIGKNFVNLDDTETARRFISILDHIDKPFLYHLIKSLSPTNKANLLIVACSTSSIEDETTREKIISFLLEAGATANGDPTISQTPLVSSLESIQKNQKILQILLDHHANPNKQGRNGFTPLMAAIRLSNLEDVEFLHERGAKIDNLKNQNGETALMLAVEKKNLDIINYLIKHGAEIAFQGLAMQTATNAYFPDQEIINHLKKELEKQRAR